MEASALVMDCKRFAVHDGPGIRTTLFLKGCPLRCVWCHNPEGISAKPQMAYYEQKCIQCGQCLTVCPQRAHRMTGGRHQFLRENCVSCGRCEEACLGEAMKFYGRTITVSQAAAALLEDRAFYRDSGGVTVSGGEPLLYAGFLRELFTRLKTEKIHTAIDTCGCVPFSAFEKVLPVTDLFLYDIKQMDPLAHQKLTGQDNGRILENIRLLSQLGKEIEVRIPLVPGCNDSPEHLQRAGEFLGQLSLTRVKVLPYHSMARSKYQSLGLPDTMPRVGSPTDRDLHSAVALLQRCGLPAVSGREA